MKKIWTVVGIAVLGFIVKIAAFGVGGAVGKSAVTAYNNSTEYQQMDRKLAEAMNSINKQTPVMVDKSTRLDNATGFNHQLQYNYTMIDYDGAEVPGQKFADALRPALFKTVCYGKTMKVFPENGVTVSYAYRGKDGADITVITITPEECKNASTQ